MEEEKKEDFFCAGVYLLLLLLFTSLCCLPGCMGCFRVIYVKNGDPVRLAQPVKAKVWVKGADGKWVKSDNEIVIDEGWYALPDPGPAAK